MVLSWVVDLGPYISEYCCQRVTFPGPDPAKRWPDPTRDSRQKVWPDPTRPSLPHMYYVSWVQHSNCQQRTIIYTISRETFEIYFSSDLVMFPACIMWKKRSRKVFFFKTVVSKQHFDNNYQMLVKCIRGSIIQSKQVWTLKSEQFVSCKVQTARVPDPTQSPNLYEFNIASTLYQPAIAIVVRDYMARTDEKSLSGWATWL